MNTPSVQTVTPEDTCDGHYPDGEMTRNEFIALLELYGRHNALPIDTDNAVSELTLEIGPLAY